jgi:DNA-binding MarR family transcriptional regulator
LPPRISYLVGRLDRVLRRNLVAALEPHRLTLPEYTALSVLSGRSGLSNAQLARRALITPQAMNEVLARLEDRGFVRRRPDPANARVRPAELTAAGQRRLHDADGAIDAIEREMLRGLAAPERRRLAGLLEGALRGLDGNQ